MPQSVSFPVAPLLSPRNCVLLVNCYFDYSREPMRRARRESTGQRWIIAHIEKEGW
jgi:hypothetical protein